MNFEFHSNKSASNKEKHGIDFIEAQALWKDEFRIVFPARMMNEIRYVLVGSIKKKHWSAIYTLRNENIRLISVRRSRKEEIKLYEG